MCIRMKKESLLFGLVQVKWFVDIKDVFRVSQEIRRVSDPDKAQIIWDGIKTVRAQKQIPALPRLSRYMNR